MDFGATFATIIAAACALGYLAAIGYAVLQVVRAPDLIDIERVVWVAAVVFAPVLGSILWYAAGPHPFGLRLTHARR